MSVNEILTGITGALDAIIIKGIELGPTMVYVVGALIIAYLIIKVVKHFLKKLFIKTDFDEDVEHLIVNASGWVLWFITIIILVGQLGMESVFESLVAIGALGGLAIALAVKDSLKDVVAGLMILKDRHFNLNDRVKIGTVEGIVFDVSLRKTRIETDDEQIVIVANSKIDSGGWTLISRDGNKAINYKSERDINEILAKEGKMFKKVGSVAKRTIKLKKAKKK